MARNVMGRIEALEAALGVDGYKVNVGSIETVLAHVERIRAARGEREKAKSAESDNNKVLLSADPAPQPSPENNGDVPFWSQEKLKLTSHHRTRDAAKDFEEQDPLADYRGRDVPQSEPDFT